MQVLRQLFFADPIYFDAHPTTHANVWWPIKFLWRLLDQHLLNADGRRNSHGYMAIAVMVIRKHRKHFLIDKPRRLAMRDLLPRAGQRQTNMPHAFDLLFAFVLQFQMLFPGSRRFVQPCPYDEVNRGRLAANFAQAQIDLTAVILTMKRNLKQRRTHTDSHGFLSDLPFHDFLPRQFRRF